MVCRIGDKYVASRMKSRRVFVMLIENDTTRKQTRNNSVTLPYSKIMLRECYYNNSISSSS